MARVDDANAALVERAGAGPTALVEPTSAGGKDRPRPLIVAGTRVSGGMDRL